MFESSNRFAHLHISIEEKHMSLKYSTLVNVWHHLANRCKTLTLGTGLSIRISHSYNLLQSVSSPDTISKLQNQIKQAREVIEQLETDRQIAIAEVKQQVHEEMERKDAELSDTRRQAITFKEENEALKERTEKLEKAGKV